MNIIILIAIVVVIVILFCCVATKPREHMQVSRGVKMSLMSRENDNPLFDLAAEKGPSGSFGQEITQGLV